MFGFSPKISWQDGLYDTLEWYVKYYKQNNNLRYFEGPNKFYNK